MAKRKGRPRKTSEQKLKDAQERNAPNDRVLERRKLFGGIVQLPKDKRLEGRNGEIDSEVCDGIGQLCALGLLDGHGHDPIEMRDKGRFWGQHYARLMKVTGVKMGSYERSSRSEPTHSLTAADLLFDRMDANLASYDRSVLLTLVVDPLIGYHEIIPWAKSLIDQELLRRHRLPMGVVRFPDAQDWAYLHAAIRALCALVDGALPSRREQCLGRAA